MSTFVSFPKIGQYNATIQSICSRERYIGPNEDGEPQYDNEKALPTVTAIGTVKLHGTNAGIGFLGDEIWFQSRTGVITPVKDNAGFAAAMSSEEKISALKEINRMIRENHNVKDEHTIIIFGEWCGKGVQKSVAISELSKRFVIFAIRCVDTNRDENGNYTYDKWLPIAGYENIDIDVYNIENFNKYELEINLNVPSSVIDTIQEIVDNVEQECPVAKNFGVSGIGEGLVWTIDHMGTIHRFKTKGKKHSVVKPKDGKTAQVDVEKLNSINEFVEYTVTEARLEQGIDVNFNSKNIIPTVKETGVFLKWLVSDIVEEEINTLSDNGLSVKDVSGAISKVGREWFFKHLDKLTFGDNK